MIEVANRRAGDGLEFFQGDCENLPFADNSFDTVLCTMSFHHCKCQYKNVAFLSYKNVGKPTRLYDIFCILIFLNHVLYLIL